MSSSTQPEKIRWLGKSRSVWSQIKLKPDGDLRWFGYSRFGLSQIKLKPDENIRWFGYSRFGLSQKKFTPHKNIRLFSYSRTGRHIYCSNQPRRCGRAAIRLTEMPRLHKTWSHPFERINDLTAGRLAQNAPHPFYYFCDLTRRTAGTEIPRILFITSMIWPRAQNAPHLFAITDLFRGNMEWDVCAIVCILNCIVMRRWGERTVLTGYTYTVIQV